MSLSWDFKGNIFFSIHSIEINFLFTSQIFFLGGEKKIKNKKKMIFLLLVNFNLEPTEGYFDDGALSDKGIACLWHLLNGHMCPGIHIQMRLLLNVLIIGHLIIWALNGVRRQQNSPTDKTGEN